MGFCISLAIGAIFAGFLLMAFPLYNGYFKAKTIMVGVAQLPLAEVSTYSKVVEAIDRRAQINLFPALEASAIRENKGRVRLIKKKDKRVLVVDYTQENHLAYNLYLKIHVKEAITLGENSRETVRLLDDEK